jgi:hypothetical protein
MKRILLPFLLFASPVIAHPDEIWIRHPQANVNYICPRGYSLDSCIETACNYATQFSCRVIAQNQNTYYIETYVPPDYRPPVVVVAPSPVVYYNPPPVFLWFSVTDHRPRSHQYHHRPRRR